MKFTGALSGEPFETQMKFQFVLKSMAFFCCLWLMGQDNLHAGHAFCVIEKYVSHVEAS
jgi:hypothetical protein